MIETTVRLFTGAFKALFSNFENFLKICWAWFAITFAIQAVLGMWSFETQIASGEEQAPNLAAGIILAVLGVISSASISVAWHRCLLLNEAPRLVHLKVGGREIAYAGRFLMLFVLWFVVLFVMMFVMAPLFMLFGISSGSTVMLAIIFCIVFLLLPIIARVALILPASALDEPLSLKNAFRNSKGLGWPMTLAGIGTIVVIALPLTVLPALAGIAGSGVMSMIATLILFVAGQIAITALQIGILTGGYYVLRERQMMPNQTMSTAGDGMSPD